MNTTRHRRLPRPRTPEPDPITTILDAVATRARARFRGHGVRVGNSNVIHEVTETEWIGGTTHPAPACHVGFTVNVARLSPVHGEITCRRCRRASTPVTTTGIVQVPLFEVTDLARAA